MKALSKPPYEVVIKAKGPYQQKNPIIVTVEAFNNTSKDVWIETTNTPFEWSTFGETPAFKISKKVTGALLSFNGPLAKRAISEENLTKIAPGSSITATVDLTRGYTLVPGLYIINLQEYSFNERRSLTGGTPVVSSAPVPFEVKK
eukprot:TRINITY_DN2430_c0_g1_i2.p1 TRINITY_DN2430_c0_g1~~TRINITY_DN2430_c0_g1_i2.p1  ORF type:complete len:146 (-),score=17.08 TRINITY_DN2430_c0_g1_i2:77-514(-)